MMPKRWQGDPNRHEKLRGDPELAIAHALTCTRCNKRRTNCRSSESWPHPAENSGVRNQSLCHCRQEGSRDDIAETESSVAKDQAACLQVPCRNARQPAFALWDGASNRPDERRREADASQAAPVIESVPSCRIIGRTGVKANRPIPMATASATNPAETTLVVERGRVEPGDS
jgi:hypothetical protein